jgi:ppGpp synthetase/RelA/SpoT-type nucleotidyltranferase
MNPVPHEALRDWYVTQRPLYDGLCKVLENTLRSVLDREGIHFLSVSARPKTVDSLMEKVRRKTYLDPRNEITDLAGARIITYVEGDLERVCQIIRKLFRVHDPKSPDKMAQLGVDRIGYRSVHYVCDLGDDRCKLPEFEVHKNLLFEVQIRTVLQHAWAEIEHDRGYKFGGILDPSLRRRLNLVAGLLEIADREFSAIARDIDKTSLASRIPEDDIVSSTESQTT